MSYKTLHERLKTDIAKQLKEELGISNVHALPRLKKIMVNVGINKSKMDSKELHEYIMECLKKITGQKPVQTRSRKAISNFKTREGGVVGAIVTMRGKQMEAFLDRLVSYILPRIRDFRGLPNKLDGKGNYALGLKDHTIFPEIGTADTAKIFGLQIQLTISGGSDANSRALLHAIGMPMIRAKSKVADSSGSSDTTRPAK
jgi:large subunit ribosomal protein L5